MLLASAVRASQVVKEERCDVAARARMSPRRDAEGDPRVLGVPQRRVARDVAPGTHGPTRLRDARAAGVSPARRCPRDRRRQPGARPRRRPDRRARRAGDPGGVRALRAVLVRRVPDPGDARAGVQRAYRDGRRRERRPRARGRQGRASAPSRTWGTGTRRGHWFGSTGIGSPPSPRSSSRPGSTTCSCATARSSGCASSGSTKDGHVGQQLKQRLSENWMVALVADRDLTGRGIEVEMFGATRRVPAGPALLSLSSGAPLVVCPVYTRDDGWEVRIGEPLEIERSGVIARGRRRALAADGRAFERAIAAEAHRTGTCSSPRGTRSARRTPCRRRGRPR